MMTCKVYLATYKYVDFHFELTLLKGYLKV